MNCDICKRDIEPMVPYLDILDKHVCVDCASVKTLDELRFDFGIDYKSNELYYADTDSVVVDGEKISDGLEIRTGYFANAKKYPEDYVQVSIALYSPKDYHGLEYKSLSPTKEILFDWKKTHDIKNYIESFYSIVLGNLNPVDVISDLVSLTSGHKKIILLCYEKSGNFCHRHIVAEWLNKAGYNVIEA